MNRSSRWIGVACLLMAMTAAAAGLVVDASNARSFYRDFPRLTHEPRFVAPQLAILCTLNPSQEQIERLSEAQAGPHHMARIHLYASPLAKEAIAGRQNPFPVGAVIVKEKLAQDGQVSGVGGMIKRPAGYDPEHGDWEYFYAGKPGEFASGRIKNCGECHRKAENDDHVFSAWSYAE